MFVMQGHPETRRDAHGPPEEDHDQRPANEGAGPQQERAVGARITLAAACRYLEPEACARSRGTVRETRQAEKRQKDF